MLQRARAGTFELRIERLDARARAAISAALLRVMFACWIQIGTRLLLALHGAGAFLDQILGACLFLLRELQLCLGLIYLRPGLFDLLSLAVDLRLDIVDIGLRHRHLRLGLVDRDQ